MAVVRTLDLVDLGVEHIREQLAGGEGAAAAGRRRRYPEPPTCWASAASCPRACRNLR
jgi:hypothetical protein